MYSAKGGALILGDCGEVGGGGCGEILIGDGRVA